MLGLMLAIVLSIGGLDALIPLAIIIILIVAAAGASRGYSIFNLFGISTLAGIGVGRGSISSRSAAGRFFILVPQSLQKARAQHNRAKGGGIVKRRLNRMGFGAGGAGNAYRFHTKAARAAAGVLTGAAAPSTARQLRRAPIRSAVGKVRTAVAGSRLGARAGKMNAWMKTGPRWKPVSMAGKSMPKRAALRAQKAAQRVVTGVITKAAPKTLAKGLVKTVLWSTVPLAYAPYAIVMRSKHKAKITKAANMVRGKAGEPTPTIVQGQLKSWTAKAVRQEEVLNDARQKAAARAFLLGIGAVREGSKEAKQMTREVANLRVEAARAGVYEGLSSRALFGARGAMAGEMATVHRRELTEGKIERLNEHQNRLNQLASRGVAAEDQLAKANGEGDKSAAVAARKELKDAKREFRRAFNEINAELSNTYSLFRPSEWKNSGLGTLIAFGGSRIARAREGIKTLDQNLAVGTPILKGVTPSKNPLDLGENVVAVKTLFQNVNAEYNARKDRRQQRREERRHVEALQQHYEQTGDYFAGQAAAALREQLPSAWANASHQARVIWDSLYGASSGYSRGVEVASFARYLGRNRRHLEGQA